MRACWVLLYLLVSGGVGAAGCDPGGAIAQPGPGSCPATACAGGVHFAADLPTTTAAQAPTLALRLCHNGLCSTVNPTADGSAFACDFAGPLTAACRLSRSGNGLHLEVTFQGVMTGWADGDVFAVRVSLPGVAPLVDVQRAVAFTASDPAAAECTPTCKSALLS